MGGVGGWIRLVKKTLLAIQNVRMGISNCFAGKKEVY
jgi:hypothetical protein